MTNDQRGSDGRDEPTTDEGLSIGGLARATGISIHSLRMWERRYGSPESLRRESGHRRYPQEEVPRLRAVARALAAGFRARQVVTASIEEIDRMLSERNAAGGSRRRSPYALETNRALNSHVEEWLRAAEDYDEARFSALLSEAWAHLGPLDFLNNRAIPFAKRVGDCWQTGALMVSHEHFAMQRLCDFMATKWRSLNERASGRVFMLGTFPRDRHTAGLQMVALVTAMLNHRVVYLGADVPEDELAEAAHQCRANAVCIGISSSIPTRFATDNLKSLRASLPGEVEIVVGGSGAPTGIKGVRLFRTLSAYYDWLHSWSIRRIEPGI